MDLLQLQGVWFEAPPPPPVVAPIGTWLLRGVGRFWWAPILMGVM